MPGRLPTWSAGGADGRRLLDPFLEGLRHHLAPGGRAIITHNSFIGLDRSRAILAGIGLTLRIAQTTLVNLPEQQARAHDAGRARRGRRTVDSSLRALCLRRVCTSSRSASPGHWVDEGCRRERPGGTFRATVLVVLALLAAFAAWPLHAQSAHSPDAALARLLKDARAKLPGACTQPQADRLIKILCAKRIRIGVRDYYPAVRHAQRRRARRATRSMSALAIGRMLGVEVEFIRVNAATRIPLLAEDRIDLVIATMGHNTQRDGQVRFIRPHYYQSETTVVGPRELPVARRDRPAGPHGLRHHRQRIERRAGVARARG